MILIKLGGSVITDKSQYKKFNKEQTSRLCREIAESGQEVIVVHGAGSFGHVLAKKHSIQDGLKNDSQIIPAMTVHHDAMELSMLVTSELMSVGIPAASVSPGSCFVLDNGKLVEQTSEPMRRMHELGIMPVTFGDVLMDRKRGFGIASGDQLMEIVAKQFNPKRVIFVSDIDGLYDSDPKSNPNTKFFPEVNHTIVKSVDCHGKVDDVTGGVLNKMESMLRMCGPGRDCVLVNGTVPGRLGSLLKGEQVKCTIAKR